jgi:hypothetical protein
VIRHRDSWTGFRAFVQQAAISLLRLYLLICSKPLPSPPMATATEQSSNNVWFDFAEIIAIMDEERRGFDEMEALALASLFWRRRRQPNSKTERRQRLELR